MTNRLAAFVVVGAIAVLGAAYLLDQDKKARAAERAKVEQQRAKDIAEQKRKERLEQIARDAPENRRKDREFAAKMDAELRSRDTLASMRQLASVADRYRDAARLAINTPRIALAQPVASIQQLAREARNVSTSPCTAPVKQSLVTAIEFTVDALLASMSQGDTDTPSGRASRAIQSFQAGMAECSQNPGKQ